MLIYLKVPIGSPHISKWGKIIKVTAQAEICVNKLMES